MFSIIVFKKSCIKINNTYFQLPNDKHNMLIIIDIQIQCTCTSWSVVYINECMANIRPYSY